MHVLDDVLQPNLSIVFCGTAAGDESAKRREYYAGHNNKFWKTLHNIGLTPEVLAPSQFQDLPKYGIGLTDLAKYASGMDSAIKQTDYDIVGFTQKILEYQPRILAFNGKEAAKKFFDVDKCEYGLQRETIGKTLIYVLPSTSGAASKYWDEKFWVDLKKSL